VMTTPIRACDLRFRASPWRGIAPSRRSAGRALLQRSSRRSPAHHRPDVSLSRAFPLACASSSLPPPGRQPVGTSSPRPRAEGHQRVTPFPLSLARTLRVTRSTGCRDGAHGSVRGLPASSPVPFWLQRCRLLRWCTLTMTPPRRRFRYPEVPARRSCRIEASRYRRLPPLQPVEDQSLGWGVGWHLGT